MSSYVEKILREAKIAHAIFDQDLFLQDNSKLVSLYSAGRLQKKSATLWEVFPELIGAEDKVDTLLHDSMSRYELEKLSRVSSDDKLRYYTLTLLPFSEDKAPGKFLLAMITDTTRETSLEQQIQQQRNEIRLLHANLNSITDQSTTTLYGTSEAIQAVRTFIDKIAEIKNTTILLQGESGTGKNLVARAIHQKSMQPDAPFVEINCASIPETLIESEIFGYEKGAFTNALSSKKGLLEEANNGTLFLDEIGELPISLQAKFLSFLETKRFRRLGSTVEHTVQVRIITATNRDLKQAIRNNEFREDLFYRLNVVSTKLPPLRDLGDDILLLAVNFINLYGYDFGKKIAGLTPEAEDKLRRHSWPGNVRELRNVIERAVIFADGTRLDAEDLQLFEMGEAPAEPTPVPLTKIPASGISLVEIEKSLLLQALDRAQGNQTKAAKLLDLSLDTFRYRLKKYDLG